MLHTRTNEEHQLTADIFSVVGPSGGVMSFSRKGDLDLREDDLDLFEKMILNIYTVAMYSRKKAAKSCLYYRTTVFAPRDDQATKKALL